MTSNPTAIPAWNIAGTLPPIRPGAPGHSADRSPYVADLAVVIERFATSPERRGILDGLLRYRADLHRAGITSGFQWLDGSFVEQIEVLASRAPKDMDVVTFFHLPEGQDQRTCGPIGALACGKGLYRLTSTPIRMNMRVRL